MKNKTKSKLNNFLIKHHNLADQYSSSNTTKKKYKILQQMINIDNHYSYVQQKNKDNKLSEKYIKNETEEGAMKMLNRMYEGLQYYDNERLNDLDQRISKRTRLSTKSAIRSVYSTAKIDRINNKKFNIIEKCRNVSYIKPKRLVDTYYKTVTRKVSEHQLKKRSVIKNKKNPQIMKNRIVQLQNRAMCQYGIKFKSSSIKQKYSGLSNYFKQKQNLDQFHQFKQFHYQPQPNNQHQSKINTHYIQNSDQPITKFQSTFIPQSFLHKQSASNFKSAVYHAKKSNNHKSIKYFRI